MENMQINENKTIINIFKGVGIALITTLVMLIIFSIILTYTNIQENVINPVILIITAISILLGSSLVSMKLKKNGLINGGIIGGIYILIIYLVSSILNWKFSLNLQSIIMIVTAVIFGVLGGIIGVNKKWYSSQMSLFVEIFLLTNAVLQSII